jgi:hypothetical protein
MGSASDKPWEHILRMGDKWPLKKIPTSLDKCDFTLCSECPRNLRFKKGHSDELPKNSSLCLAIGLLREVTFLVFSRAYLSSHLPGL